jgi:hypothetical protein
VAPRHQPLRLLGKLSLQRHAAALLSQVAAGEGNAEAVALLKALGARFQGVTDANGRSMSQVARKHGFVEAADVAAAAEAEEAAAAATPGGAGLGNGLAGAKVRKGSGRPAVVPSASKAAPLGPP